MFHISDEPRDVVSADEQPFLYACDLEGEDPRQGWVPMDDDIVMFMSDGRECPLCRHSLDERGRAPQLCLHVRKAGEILTITHACNLHEPGEFIIARRMAVWPKQSLYQLASSPLPGADLSGVSSRRRDSHAFAGEGETQIARGRHRRGMVVHGRLHRCGLRNHRLNGQNSRR